jgi:hypothetical protein
MVQKKRRDISVIAKNVIVGVIISAMSVVAVMTAFHFFHSPENVTKSRIESIAADYYENYFYKNIIKNVAGNNTLASIMPKYNKDGFSRVSLRQLLLYDDKKHAAEGQAITKYCDEGATSIQIFPDPPYGSKDYHIKYYYSCEF